MAGSVNTVRAITVAKLKCDSTTPKPINQSKFVQLFGIYQSPSGFWLFSAAKFFVLFFSKYLTVHDGMCMLWLQNKNLILPLGTLLIVINFLDKESLN